MRPIDCDDDDDDDDYIVDNCEAALSLYQTSLRVKLQSVYEPDQMFYNLRLAYQVYEVVLDLHNWLSRSGDLSLTCHLLLGSTLH